jgi:hypothetical protein
MGDTMSDQTAKLLALLAADKKRLGVHPCCAKLITGPHSGECMSIAARQARGELDGQCSACHAPPNVTRWYSPVAEGLKGVWLCDSCVDPEVVRERIGREIEQRRRERAALVKGDCPWSGELLTFQGEGIFGFLSCWVCDCFGYSIKDVIGLTSVEE